MKRKTTEEKENLFANYLKFKWELCRRNKDYILDYKRFESEEIEPEEMRRKWGFYDDPSENSEQAMPAFPVYFKEDDMDSYQQGYFPICKDLFTLSVIKDRKKGKTIKIVIELVPEAPINIILAALEHLFHQKTIADFPDKRPQWGQLELDLTIFDYVQEQKNHDQIAELCYPRDDLDTAISKVSKGLARIRKKIKTGKIW